MRYGEVMKYNVIFIEYVMLMKFVKSKIAVHKSSESKLVKMFAPNFYYQKSSQQIKKLSRIKHDTFIYIFHTII